MESSNNRPNRAEQRAARQLAKDQGLTYQQALQQLRQIRDNDHRETRAASAPVDTDESSR